MTVGNKIVEIERVAGIIKSTLPAGAISDYDAVFTERLNVYPIALTVEFWANHFEWQSLKEYPQIKGKILDFGCGSGHPDIFLARSGMTVHGIDMSRVGIAIARDAMAHETEDVKARLYFEVADITFDPPHDELFDSAWASHVFEHIANPAPILSGLQKWLKPGAYLLISVPHGNAYNDPSHVNHYQKPDDFLRYLAKNAVNVERIDVSAEHKVLRILWRMPL